MGGDDDEPPPELCQYRGKFKENMYIIYKRLFKFADKVIKLKNNLLGTFLNNNLYLSHFSPIHTYPMFSEFLFIIVPF